MITVRGHNQITLDKLKRVRLEPPANAGSYWQGVPHHELVQTILTEARRRDWEVLDMKFSLARHGADLAGAFQVRLPDVQAPKGQTLALGVLTSNARRRALTLLAGSVVTSCANGLVSGKILLQKKHTGALDLNRDIAESLDIYAAKARALPKLVSRLQARTLSKGQAAHLILSAGRQGIMPRTLLLNVHQEYEEPRFPEIGTGTAWALLNAFSHVNKASPPIQQLERLDAFRSMMDRFLKTETVAA